MHKTSQPHVALTQFQIYQKQQKCSNHRCNQSKNQKRCKSTVLSTFSGIFRHLRKSVSERVLFRIHVLSKSQAHFWRSDGLSLQVSKTAMNLHRSIRKTVDSWQKKPISDTVLFSIILFWDERSLSCPLPSEKP